MADDFKFVLIFFCFNANMLFIRALFIKFLIKKLKNFINSLS